MSKNVFSGFVGAAVMFIAMTVLGATHQPARMSEMEKKLDQLRVVMLMAHQKEINDFLKPWNGKGKPEPDIAKAFIPFYEAIEDVGKPEDGMPVSPGMFYYLSGKTIEQAKKEAGK